MRQFGDKIRSLPFGELTEREDLLYYDGPLLSLFRSASGKTVLFYWCESDTAVNRWLVFEITEREAALLRNDKITISELTENRNCIYFVDIDANLQYKEIRKLHPASIPSSYLPETSYYRVASLKPSPYAPVVSFMNAIRGTPYSESFFEFDKIERIRRSDVGLSVYHMA